MQGGGAITVVKLGGSHAFSSALKGWLGALAECAGQVVLVPGGGFFADAVRLAQAKMGFDDRAAHHMALLAMEQYGCALASLGGKMRLAASTAAIGCALRRAEVPVWSPAQMVLASRDIPWSWEATSDSLAAWLAGQIGATRVLLVKQTEPAADVLHADDLVARGIVDPLFPRFLAKSGAEAAMAGPADHAACAAAIRNGLTPGTRIDLP